MPLSTLSFLISPRGRIVSFAIALLATVFLPWQVSFFLIAFGVLLFPLPLEYALLLIAATNMPKLLFAWLALAGIGALLRARIRIFSEAPPRV